MSGQRQDQPSIDDEMEDAPTGGTIDLQDVARGVNSGKVEAEEQSTPQGEIRTAHTVDDEPDDQPSW